MGRKKIAIQTISDERGRQVTFSKRRYGIMKKAYELSVLCGCEIGIVMFNCQGKLFQFATHDLDSLLMRYTECEDALESKNNADIERMIERGVGKMDDDADYLCSSGEESLASPQSDQQMMASFY